jgi:tetratricopeptide (TPR) repeat protein
MYQGQKHAQALLNGSIAFFEHLGATARAAEARVELARSYYHEGLFDLARRTVSSALKDMPDDQGELRGVGLVLQAGIERDAGRLRDSFNRLKEAMRTMEPLSPLIRGRYHHELATTLKEIANSSYCESYYEDAMLHFRRALEEFEAVGNHRHAAASQNNLGFLLLDLRKFDESEFHLLRARQFFLTATDLVRCAQVNDTLAKLYLETQRFELAENACSEAVRILTDTDQDALLAEALTTQGLVECAIGKYGEAKKSFDAANRIANLCGDREGAGRALLIMFEEMADHLTQEERVYLTNELRVLLGATQQASIATRLRKALAFMSSN